MQKTLLFVVLSAGCSSAILPVTKGDDSGISVSEADEWSSGTASSDGDAADGATEDVTEDVAEDPTEDATENAAEDR